MGRWEPDAAPRLMRAALELFVEKGYDHTTVVEIAERAGVTKSTFFRHFRDKREVLFGGETFGRLIADGIAQAPPGATPLDAVAAGLDAVGREAFTPETRQLSRRRRAVIAANTELQERDALKRARLSVVVTEALRARGVPDPEARLVTQLGLLALGIAYERWSESGDGREFGQVAREALSELLAASASLR